MPRRDCGRARGTFHTPPRSARCTRRAPRAERCRTRPTRRASVRARSRDDMRRRASRGKPRRTSARRVQRLLAFPWPLCGESLPGIRRDRTPFDGSARPGPRFSSAALREGCRAIRRIATRRVRWLNPVVSSRARTRRRTARSRARPRAAYRARRNASSPSRRAGSCTPRARSPPP